MVPHSAGHGGEQLMHGSAELDRYLPPRFAAPTAPPYSVRSNVMVAFFGGVYAIVLFSLLNSRRTGRLRADLPLYGGLALSWTLAILWLSQADDFGGLAAFALPSEQPRDFRLLSRVASLAVCGLLHLRLRRLYAPGGSSEGAMSETLKAGTFALIAGTGLTLLVGFVGLSLR